MTHVTKLVSTLIIFVFSCSVHAENTLTAGVDNELGSMMLFSAGFVGLFAARKHMASKAS